VDAIKIATFVALFLMKASAISPERYYLMVGEVHPNDHRHQDVTDTYQPDVLTPPSGKVQALLPKRRDGDAEVLARLEDSFASCARWRSCAWG
jgi:hypothetical protein